MSTIVFPRTAAVAAALTLAVAAAPAGACGLHEQPAPSVAAAGPSAQTLVAAQLAHAHQLYRLGDLVIEGPFSRASAGPGRAGAAYMAITNTGDADDRLIAAVTEVSTVVELHTHSMDAQGVMRMREVEGGIPIPAGETVTLQPGGLHVMLMGLETRLTDGETDPLTLEFEQAGRIEVLVSIGGVAAGAPPAAGHDHR